MCGDTACTSHTESGETFGEDEGFDQGGLRKAWIELIATHFVRSDLSVHAEEEASMDGLCMIVTVWSKPVHITLFAGAVGGRKQDGTKWLWYT